MLSRRTAVAAVLSLGTALALTACGGSGITLPTASPTISLPSISRTPSLPTPTRTVPSGSATATDQPTSTGPTTESPTSSPSRTASASVTPTRSDTPTATPTSAKPTSASPTSAKPTTASPTSASPTSASPTPTPTSASPTSASPTSASPTSASPTSTSPTASPEPEPASGSLPWWLWALIAAAILGGGAWWFVVGAKRRKWDAAFASTLAEIRWATDVLAPSVVNRALPADQVAAQWTDSKRRLDDLQSSLYRMQSDIPTPDRAQRLGVVTGALTAMTAALEHDVAIRTGGYALTEPDLLASAQSVEHARTTLSAAVSGAPTSPGGAHQS